MNRLICLVLSVVFATLIGDPLAHAQDKKDPPKHYTNSLGMKFVWIKPGTFMMGSLQGKEVFDNETQHKVTLTRGFYMGVYTVTQEQWQEVMGNNPSKFKGEKNLPVDSVSWNDSQEFIKKLRDKEKDKKPYRLPTDAEWEYACRAGTTTPFNFGEAISTDQANYVGEFAYGDGKKGVYRKATTPVGTFSANSWGLHDMHGNVSQWCQDWYGEYPENVTDPQGPEKVEIVSCVAAPGAPVLGSAAQRAVMGFRLVAASSGCESVSRWIDSLTTMKDDGSYICDSCGEEIVVPIEVSAGSSQKHVEDCQKIVEEADFSKVISVILLRSSAV